MSSTTASRRPSIRFTRVDLPTLGRPTTARTGAVGGASSASAVSSMSPSPRALSSWANSPGSIPSRAMYATSASSLRSLTVVTPYLVQFDDQPGQCGPDGLGGGGQPGPAAAGGHCQRLAHQHVHPRAEPPSHAGGTLGTPC